MSNFGMYLFRGKSQRARCVSSGRLVTQQTPTMLIWERVFWGVAVEERDRGACEGFNIRRFDNRPRPPATSHHLHHRRGCFYPRLLFPGYIRREGVVTKGFPECDAAAEWRLNRGFNCLMVGSYDCAGRKRRTDSLTRGWLRCGARAGSRFASSCCCSCWWRTAGGGWISVPRAARARKITRCARAAPPFHAASLRTSFHCECLHKSGNIWGGGRGGERGGGDGGRDSLLVRYPCIKCLDYQWPEFSSLLSLKYEHSFKQGS